MVLTTQRSGGLLQSSPGHLRNRAGSSVDPSLGHLIGYLLLRDLAADFASRVRCRMDVDVVLASQEVCGLSISQRGAAFGRALADVGDRNGDAGILVSFSGPMEMRRRGRAGESGIGHVPAQFFGGRIVFHVGTAGPGAGRGRHFGLATQRHLVLVGEGGSRKGYRSSECEHGKGGLGHGSLSLMPSVDDADFPTMGIPVYSRNPLKYLKILHLPRAGVKAGAASYWP